MKATRKTDARSARPRLPALSTWGVVGGAAPGLRGPLVLTALLDRSRVRTGGDSYFPAAANAAPLRRTEVRKVADPVVIPLELLAVLALVARGERRRQPLSASRQA